MATELDTDPLLRTVPEEGGYKLLDPVELHERIGKGGMGAVYRGRHRNLEIEVAVKILDPHLARQDESFVSRFRREARIAAGISHTNLVHVYDVRELDGLHFIVMEYVPGETALKRVSRKGPLQVGEAITIVAGAAKGLAAAHAAGVIHRDVKPENILLDHRGRVKVADLGLAKAVGGDGGLTQTSMRMGTPRYMPPEQWEDAKTVGPSGDVWALGATLYFLLVAEHAIGGESYPEILKRACIEPFPDIRKSREWLPDELAGILERCTAKDPKERYADASELHSALIRFKSWLDNEEGSSASHPPATIIDEEPSAPTSAGMPGTGVSPSPSSSVKTIAKKVGRSRFFPTLVTLLLIGGGAWWAVGTGALRWGDDTEPGGASASRDSEDVVPVDPGSLSTPGVAEQSEVLQARSLADGLSDHLDVLRKNLAARQADEADPAEKQILAEIMRETDATVFETPERRDLDAELQRAHTAEKEGRQDDAKALYEKCCKGYEELTGRTDAVEARIRTRVRSRAVSDLRAGIESFFARELLKAPPQFAEGKQAVLEGDDFARDEKYAEALGAYKRAEELLRRAEEAGPAIVASRTDARDAQAQARLAARNWKSFATDSPVPAPAKLKEAETQLGAAESLLEAQSFDDAAETFRTAKKAFDETLVEGKTLDTEYKEADQARIEAERERRIWRELPETARRADSPEVVAANRKMTEAASHLEKHNYVEARSTFDAAAESFRMAAATDQRIAGERRTTATARGAALAGQRKWRALAKLHGLEDDANAIRGAGELAKGDASRDAGNFAAARDAYARAETAFGAAHAAGERISRLGGEVEEARKEARSARTFWLDAMRKLSLPENADARSGKTWMEQGEAALVGGDLETALQRFRAAATAYRSAGSHRSDARVPPGWTVEGDGKSASGWALRATDPRSGITFVLIRSGRFVLGSRAGGRDAKRPVSVEMPIEFYLAETETTVGQWNRFAGKTKSRKAQGKDDLPMRQVTWVDARRFCDYFNGVAGVAGGDALRYRLPTEAEWEYCCRAGTGTHFWWGQEPRAGAGNGNFGDVTAMESWRKDPGMKDFRKVEVFPFADRFVGPAPVRTFQPNPWGLYDMLGNVAEWCDDYYHPKWYTIINKKRLHKNPRHPNPRTDVRRVVRGGSFVDGFEFARSHTRHNLDGRRSAPNIGFRVAFTPAR